MIISSTLYLITTLSLSQNPPKTGQLNKYKEQFVHEIFSRTLSLGVENKSGVPQNKLYRKILVRYFLTYYSIFLIYFLFIKSYKLYYSHFYLTNFTHDFIILVNLTNNKFYIKKYVDNIFLYKYPLPLSSSLVPVSAK